MHVRRARCTESAAGVHGRRGGRAGVHAGAVWRAACARTGVWRAGVRGDGLLARGPASGARACGDECTVHPRARPSPGIT
ncbi:hypothetical protein CRG98_018078 [Punica granatum]|uniref:Uncharacterized protein n=1 Tax=Punica granatum TaxID=22663 RepID=A0A2I0JYY3_PUNGR|nr:hypothetical protein CRG98_018078 [Punica granatum]